MPAGCAYTVTFPPAEAGGKQTGRLKADPSGPNRKPGISQAVRENGTDPDRLSPRGRHASLSENTCVSRDNVTLVYTTWRKRPAVPVELVERRGVGGDGHAGWRPTAPRKIPVLASEAIDEQEEGLSDLDWHIYLYTLVGPPRHSRCYSTFSSPCSSSSLTSSTKASNCSAER